MKIGINLLLMLPHAGGVVNYVLTFLREWPNYYPDDPLILFSFHGNDELLDTLPAEARQNEIRLLSQPEILNHCNKFDILFCPFGSLAPRPVPKPSVITMVDIQERFYPEHFKQEDIINRLYHYDASLKMTDQIITISEFSKKSISGIIGIPDKKLNVIYLTPDKLPVTCSRPLLPDGWGKDTPFIFYPANDWPHKNHLRLIEALFVLKQSGFIVSCVFTGACQEFYMEIIQEVERIGLNEQVLHLGMISRKEIAWLYRNARMLIFPSFFEGFGIPVVEAMASGLPVVCSGTTSLPEVGGNAAVYFDPMNTDDMAEKIQTVFKDNSLRNRMILNGKEWSKRFSSELMIKRHKAVFEKALTSYRGYRYYRQKMLDEPLAQMFQRKSVPDNQRTKALEILRVSDLQPPSGLKKKSI